MRLPFERAYLIESRTCERCNGTGQYALGKPCYDCGQLGRLFTPAGRAVLLDVAALLSIADPIDEHRSRWRLWTPLPIQAKHVKPGMRVPGCGCAAIRPARSHSSAIGGS